MHDALSQQGSTYSIVFMNRPFRFLPFSLLSSQPLFQPILIDTVSSHILSYQRLPIRQTKRTSTMKKLSQYSGLELDRESRPLTRHS